MSFFRKLLHYFDSDELDEICTVCNEQITYKHREGYTPGDGQGGTALHNYCLDKYVSTIEEESKEDRVKYAEPKEDLGTLFTKHFEEEITNRENYLKREKTLTKAYKRIAKRAEQDITEELEKISLPEGYLFEISTSQPDLTRKDCRLNVSIYDDPNFISGTGRVIRGTGLGSIGRIFLGEFLFRYNLSDGAEDYILQQLDTNPYYTDNGKKTPFQHSLDSKNFEEGLRIALKGVAKRIARQEIKKKKINQTEEK